MKVREYSKAYEVEEEEFFPWPEWFPELQRHEWENRKLRLNTEGLTLKIGFLHNGANGFPDYDWIVVPSGVHDALLWIRSYLKLATLDDKEFKYFIDKWFVELAAERMPTWRRLTPTTLFFGVNKLSKWVPGKDQVEAHAIKEYF